MATEGKETTGMAGLDKMLNGGYPHGSVVLIHGGPGAGKSTFCMQFLLDGIKNGQNGLYISLEESTEEIMKAGKNFGWDLEGVTKEGTFQLIAIDFKRTPAYIRDLSSEGPKWSINVTGAGNGKGISGKLTAATFSELLQGLIDQTKAERVVVDSLSMFSSQFAEDWELRFETIELVKMLAKTGCTALLTAQADPEGAYGFRPEEYLCHGVVNLHYVKTGNRYVMATHVLKMRNTEHDREFRPYAITDKGIKVYEKEGVFEK